MYPIVVDLGPIEVYSFSLALLTAFVACWLVVRWLLPAQGIDADEATPLLFTAALGGIAGARLAFGIAHWEYFARDPAALLRLNEGGLVFYGGVAGGVLATWLYALARRVPKGGLADVAAVAVPLGAAIGRVGCFLNGCCSGVPCQAAWGVTFPGTSVPVHPTQLYDAAYNVVIFAVMLIVVRRGKWASGAAFWLFLVLYGGARFVVESFRVQSVYVLGLSGAQAISVVVVPIAMVFLIVLLRSGRGGEAHG